MAERDEPAHARFAQSAQQDVGQRGATLSVARAQRRYPVREMNADAGIGRKGEEVFIPGFRMRRSKGDVARPGCAATDQIAHPAQGFDYLVMRVCAGDKVKCGDAVWLRYSCEGAGEPRGIGTFRRFPFDGHRLAQPIEERTPKRGDPRQLLDPHGPEASGCPVRFFKRYVADVARQHDRGRNLALSRAVQ